MAIREYPSDSAACAAAIAKAVPKHVWVDGPITRIYTGSDMPVRPVPEFLTPWQIRKALNRSGLREAVEAAVAAGGKDMQDGWEFATEILRHDPLVVAMGAALHKTDEEMDDLFRLAVTL